MNFPAGARAGIDEPDGRSERSHRRRSLLRPKPGAQSKPPRAVAPPAESAAVGRSGTSIRREIQFAAPAGWMGREENWAGLPTQWAFTFLGAGPARGATFYLAAGTDQGTIELRAAQKRQEFEAAAISAAHVAAPEASAGPCAPGAGSEEAGPAPSAFAGRGPVEAGNANQGALSGEPSAPGAVFAESGNSAGLESPRAEPVYEAGPASRWGALP